MKNNRDNKKESIEIPSAANYSSRKEWEDACWERIIESKDLFRSLISSHERHDIVLRAVARDRLASGKSYKEIGEELWLSPQTISGIKKAMNEKAYRSYPDRSRGVRKKREHGSTAKQKPKRRRPEGIPRRTKYGTLYM